MASFSNIRKTQSSRYHSSINNQSSSRSSSSSETRSCDIILTTTKNKNNSHNNGIGTSTFGTMVKKFMEKRSSSSNKKPSASAAPNRNIMHVLPVPTDVLIAADQNMNRNKKNTSSNLTNLPRKLFQKGGGTDRSAVKALTEVKPNTRTLAVVLRSERELLTQNKEYEEEIQDLRLLLEEKNREVEKLKDLCLKQREEIKALKDAILFPDVMNSQLNDLLEKQGSELKQARQIIPSLQKQVSSLTGQLQCLAEDLAEVKADKYAVRTCYDEYISSPLTPKSDDVHEGQNSLEYSSGCPMTTYGSPDEMFLKDLNPCLTPCFSKTKLSKEYSHMTGYDSHNSSKLSPDDDFSKCRDGIMSKSSEQNFGPSSHGHKTTARKIYKSDESKWSIGKPKGQTLF